MTLNEIHEKYKFEQKYHLLIWYDDMPNLYTDLTYNGLNQILDILFKKPLISISFAVFNITDKNPLIWHMFNNSEIP